jgi:hypothetical protein
VTASEKGTADDQSPQPDRWDWLRGLSKWITFLAALGVLAVGLLLLLLDVFGSRQVAAPFTRVGGRAQIETAVDASRFWTTPPLVFVTIQAGMKNQDLLLGAGLCAAVEDAPLLYTSPIRSRERVVDATIKEWSNTTTEYLRPSRIQIKTESDVANCLGNLTDVNGVSTLGLSDPIISLPKIRTQRTLDHAVVFAAPLAPGDPPDVAVGLALAAHLARARGEQVSLLVVPRYLEADPGLEKHLENERALVTGGVVLGQTTTVPEDTQALLRQLLTSTDRDDLLSQIQANLGSVGPLIAALLALLGLGAAARLAPEIGRQVVRTEHRYQVFERIQPMERLRSVMPTLGTKSNNDSPAPVVDWRAAMGDDKSVVLWLRSGWEVSGVVTGWFPAAEAQAKSRTSDPASTVLRLNGAKFTKNGDQRNAEWVLVPVDEIELIARHDPSQAGASSSPAA